jgi:hypothetical protein
VEPRDLPAKAREHLVVDWVVVTPREGRRIDAGEEFDVQLSVRNTFESDTFLGFRDIELLIEGTQYAEPAGDPRVSVEGGLSPGERKHLVVRFRALAADPITEGTTQQEPVGKVRARAGLALEAMPAIETEPRLLTAQIHGGPHRE